MDDKREILLKEVRSCHTKQAWESFFINCGQQLASLNESRPLIEIFKLLAHDPQSPQYDPAIFGILIKGCICSQNHLLGKKIYNFVRTKSPPSFSIPAASLFLELGQSHYARSIASRSLRLSQLDYEDAIWLKAIVCRSFAEEGKFKKARKLASTIRARLSNCVRFYPDVLFELARTEYLLSNFPHASHYFHEAFAHFFETKDWKQAAQALYYAAVSQRNNNDMPNESSFFILKQALALAEKFNLKNIVSQIDFFYGTQSYNQGDFIQAKAYFLKALQGISDYDRSIRRLKILSLLTSTYMNLGHYDLACKTTNQLFDFASKSDFEGNLFCSLSLKAELDWERGDPLQSQRTLASSSFPLNEKNVFSTEAFNIYVRSIYQNALLDQKPPATKMRLTICEQQRKFSIFNYHYARGQSLLTQGNIQEAYQLFADLHKESTQRNDYLHSALAQHGLIQTQLAQSRCDDETADLIHDFEQTIKKLSESPLKAKLFIVRAALSYQRGNFSECERLLKAAGRLRRVEFVDSFSIRCWLNTMKGYSCRLTQDWQLGLLGRQTRIYFAPWLRSVSQYHYQITNNYAVDLSQNPILAELLDFLIDCPELRASIDELQTMVWKESLRSYGWKQKILNALMRLRDFFRYTMAPLILPQKNISIFVEAIKVIRQREEGIERHQEILNLLSFCPMTSTQISKRLQLSIATTKREIKSLAGSGSLTSFRHGRNIYYKFHSGR